MELIAFAPVPGVFMFLLRMISLMNLNNWKHAYTLILWYSSRFQDPWEWVSRGRLRRWNRVLTALFVCSFMFLCVCIKTRGRSFYRTSVMRGEKRTTWKKYMSQVGVLLSVNTWKMPLNFVHSSGWRSRRLSDRKAAWKSGFHSLMQTVTAILASLILYSLVHRRYPGSYEEHSDSSRTLLTIFTLLRLFALFEGGRWQTAPLAFMCI